MALPRNDKIALVALVALVIAEIVWLLWPRVKNSGAALPGGSSTVSTSSVNSETAADGQPVVGSLVAVDGSLRRASGVTDETGDEAQVVHIYRGSSIFDEDDEPLVHVE